jgi:hypothetical protein
LGGYGRGVKRSQRLQEEENIFTAVDKAYYISLVVTAGVRSGQDLTSDPLKAPMLVKKTEE